jgi:hypothetical protein
MAPRPFADASPQLAWLRGTLLAACLLTMLASTPLWLSDRTYPLLPIGPWFPVAQPPLDRVVFGAALLALIAAVWFYRAAVICFLVLALYMALCDQARWQPWFYMYAVMLMLTLARRPTARAACRFAVSAVYLWSGIQKCNPDYFKVAVPWLAKAGMEWLPSFAGTLLHGALAAAPAIEIFIAMAVWSKHARRTALVLAVIVHAAALFLLGPLGHGHNWIVWPWNVATPVLLILLFRDATLKETWREMRQVRWVTATTALFAGLPVLSFFGYWDSYLSFSLYTGRLTKADVYITEEVRNRLPKPLLEFVKPTPAPFNPEIQGPYVVLVELWADKILRVPPLPEGRGYRRVAEYLAAFATDPNDVRLVLAPRVGQIRFYRGGDLRKDAGVVLNL